MYIVIYKNGNQIEEITSNTIEVVRGLKEKEDVYVFTIGKSTALNVPDGLTFIDNDEKPCDEFKHGEYTLRKINYIHDGKYNNYHYTFTFRYADNRDINVSGGVKFLPKALTNAIKIIIAAHKFNSWEEYQASKTNKKVLDNLKNENETLRQLNIALQTELIELKNKQ